MKNPTNYEKVFFNESNSLETQHFFLLFIALKLVFSSEKK